MKRLWLGIMVAIIQCLLISQACLAISPEDISIPSQYGTIKEVFKARFSTEKAEQTIIHLQDAHCNYEAQKNMAELLGYLVRKYNLKLIMVEGGSGNVSLSFLRGYADKKDREKIADRYLRAGNISGEEYLDIVSDYDLQLYGIEDEPLYDAHMVAFGEVDSIRQAGLKYIEELSQVAEALKPYIYSQPLRQLDKKRKDYQAKAISLAEYCQYLKQAADKQWLDLGGYPNFSAFLTAVHLEKEINFGEAELQRNTFIKDLAAFLDEKGLKELIHKSREFKLGRITPQEYYSFLKAAAGQKLDLAHNYPQLNSYIRYITVSKQINASDLLREISLIEQRITEACFANSDERRLSEISKSLGILRSLLNLELTPEDYEYLQANRSKFLTVSLRDFLVQHIRSYNLTLHPTFSTIIDDNLKKLEEFYRLGIQREKSFMENLVRKMEESGQKTAVLITGGFHTPAITQMLKEEGYSYVVVVPKVTEKTDSDIYFSVLRGGNNLLGKALGGDR